MYKTAALNIHDLAKKSNREYLWIRDFFSAIVLSWTPNQYLVEELLAITGHIIRGMKV